MGGLCEDDEYRGLPTKRKASREIENCQLTMTMENRKIICFCCFPFSIRFIPLGEALDLSDKKMVDKEEEKDEGVINTHWQ